MRKDVPYKETIHAQGKDITVLSDGKQIDYISLTDIAKYKSDEPVFVIRNWLRNRDTLDFLGLWETLNNPSFNTTALKTLLEESGRNSLKPAFHSDELYFRVTLPNTSYHNGDVEQTPSSSASKHLDLSDREKAVLQQIAANPTISIATIALNLDLTQKQARLVIDSLKENQILIRDGSNKTGKWKIL